MATQKADQQCTYYIDRLYDSLIHSCIENYVQYRIKQNFKPEEEIDIVDMLTYFSETRLIVAKIMNTVSDKLNANYFCKKEDIGDFGAKRRINDCAITPLYGKYKEAFIKWKGEATNKDGLCDYYEKEIWWEGYKLSHIFYTWDETMDECDKFNIRIVEHTTPVGGNLESAKKHALNQISIISKNLCKDTAEVGNDLLKIVWLLSQLTLFKRGSASISEMICACIISIVERKYSILCPFYAFKGIDLLAILNDMDEFLSKYKKIPVTRTSVDSIQPSSLIDMYNIYDMILTLSKAELLCKLSINCTNNSPASIFSKDYKKVERSFTCTVNDITNSLADIL